MSFDLFTHIVSIYFFFLGIQTNKSVLRISFTMIWLFDSDKLWTLWARVSIFRFLKKVRAEKWPISIMVEMLFLFWLLSVLRQHIKQAIVYVIDA